MSIKEISDFIKKAVEYGTTNETPVTFRLPMDDTFAIYVGWGDGFDPDDDTCYHCAIEPEFCLCAKVAENLNGYYTYEDAYMPWNGDGEVYDTDSSIPVDCGYDSLAKWLYESYLEISELYEKDELYLG